MNPKKFIDELCRIQYGTIFNPYVDRCKVWDRSEAEKQRKELLYNMLCIARQQEVQSLWIGRDLGHRGGRRTGLALTDDFHLKSHAGRWGLEAEKVTEGMPTKERTATEIWKHLSNIESNIFLWNVFPFHPHEEGKPFTNRAHTKQEKKIGEEILKELLLLLQPKLLVAIGNDAETSAMRIWPSSLIRKVRHPSYGGQREFSRRIREIYEVRDKQEELCV